MSVFFTLLWMALLIAFIVYWRKKVKAKKQIAEAPEVYAKISKTKRIIGIACIISLVLGIATAEPPTEKDNTAATPESTTKQETAVSTEQLTQDLQNFYNQLVSYDNKTKDVWNNTWVPTVNGVGTGEVDRYTAYKNMKDMYNFFDRQKLNISKNVSIPESVTDEAKDKLNEAVEDYRTALVARKQAAKKMQEVLDSGDYKPSELDEVKRQIGIADQFEIKSMATVVEVFKTLGVEIPARAE